MKFLKKLWAELTALSWTIAGTVLVLVTLSGPTQMIGFWISVIALIVHLFGVFIKFSEEDNTE
jgi:hypothetical protein